MKYILFLFSILYSLTINAQSSTIQWQKPTGGTMYDYSKEIENTSDGGYITIGYSESTDGDVSFNHGNGDCWIVKSNAFGIVQWEKTFGGTGYDYGYSIKQTNDGGYIATGYTESNDGDVSVNHGGGDCWVIKLDNSGTLVWEKTFGGTLNDNGQSICQTTDGGYVVAGNSDSNDGDVTSNHGLGDCWILKLDNAGAIQWQKAFGGSYYDYAQEIKQTNDGGFIFCGGSYSIDGDITEQKGNGDCWLVKTDNAGNIVWENSFGGSNYDFLQSVEKTNDGGYILAGYSESTDGDVAGAHGGGDSWIVKVNALGNVQWEKAFGSNGNDYAYCIQKRVYGGYVIAGYSELNNGNVSGNHGSYDCWILELDDLGAIEMQNSYGGTGVDIAYSIRETSAGNYLIAGYSDSNDGDVNANHGTGDSWVIKLTLNSVGLNENTSDQTITVAPNPSVGNFNFSGLEPESTLNIYDSEGKKIFETITENEIYELNFSDTAKGIYFYVINTKNGKISSGKMILN